MIRHFMLSQISEKSQEAYWDAVRDYFETINCDLSFLQSDTSHFPEAGNRFHNKRNTHFLFCWCIDVSCIWTENLFQSIYLSTLSPSLLRRGKSPTRFFGFSAKHYWYFLPDCCSCFSIGCCNCYGSNRHKISCLNDHATVCCRMCKCLSGYLSFNNILTYSR